MDESWLTAGAFARRSRLSAKALRLYANNRLLVPARIDESNGYRLYHESQLRDARLICMLRRADVPLALVADILAAPRGQRRALIDDHWDDVERSIQYRREFLGHLARTISGGKDTYPMAEIKVRDVPEQTLLTEQTYVNAAQLPEWIAKAGMRQLEAAADIGGQVGPSLVIYHGEVNEDSDGPVEAGLPVAAECADDTSLPTRIEPAHREAYVTITRAQVQYPDILSAYDAIERWIAAHNEQIAGSPREIYFADPSSGDDDELIADIAFPIMASPTTEGTS